MLNQEHLIQEIKNDMRREQWQRLWRDFGTHIVIISVLVIIATIAIVYWQQYQHDSAAKATGRFLAASELFAQGNYADAATAFAALQKDDDGVNGSLAGMRRIVALERLGKKEEAAQVATELFRKQHKDPALHEFTGILNAYYETPDSEKALSILKEEGKIFVASVTEAQAIAALKKGDAEASIKAWEALRDNVSAPRSLRQRATDMISLLSVKAP